MLWQHDERDCNRRSSHGDAGPHGPSPRRLRPRSQRHVSGSLTPPDSRPGAYRAGHFCMSSPEDGSRERAARATSEERRDGGQQHPSPSGPAAPGARASGRSGTASRSTPTSGPRRTTTRSTSGRGSRTSTRTAASPRSTRTTCAAGSAGGGSTPSARPASTAAARRCSSRTSSTTSTSCSGSGSTAASSASTSCARSPRSRSEFGRDTADITDRQNIQLHWIRVEDMPEIWRRLEAVGLQTTEACGDCPRVVLGSPVAGVAADEVIDPTPADRRDRRAVRRRPGVLQPAAQVQVVDLVAGRHAVRDQRHLVPRRRPPRLRPRLRPVGRRRPVDQPDAGPAARRLGAAGRGARRLGRRGRHLPRLRLPPAAAPGPAEVPGRRLGRGEVPRGAGEGVPRSVACRRSGAGRCRRSRSTTSACTGSATAVTTSAPRRSSAGSPGTQLAPARRRRRGARQRPGAASPRTRSCWSSTSPDDRVESLVTALRGIGLEARPSTWRRGTMACTGIEYCKLAIVETKARGEELVARLEERLGDIDADITIHINGCPNACARTQIADIGLKGQLVVGPDGRAGRGLPGAPRRRPRHGAGPDGRLRPQAARPQDHRGGAARVRRAAGPPLPRRPHRRARRSPSGWSGPTRRRCDELRDAAPAPMLLPVLRRRGPAPHEESHGAWECRGCARVFSVKFVGLRAEGVLNPRTEEVR